MDQYLPWIALAIIALFLALRTFGPNRRLPGPVVLAKIEAGARIVDVRTESEFKGGAYPGALNIPLDELGGRLDKLGPKDKPIVLYCASGMRSSKAAALLRKAGFTDISNAGGLSSMPR